MVTMTYRHYKRLKRWPTWHKAKKSIMAETPFGMLQMRELSVSANALNLLFRHNSPPFAVAHLAQL